MFILFFIYIFVEEVLKGLFYCSFFLRRKLKIIIIMKELENEYYSIPFDFNEPRESVKIEIKKFNKYGQLCYFDSEYLNCKGFTDDQINLLTNLFSSAGFVTEIKRRTYFGIFDPPRGAELVEVYPTDEQLLQREIRRKEIFQKIV